jgi:hypothetical protein
MNDIIQDRIPLSLSWCLSIFDENLFLKSLPIKMNISDGAIARIFSKDLEQLNAIQYFFLLFDMNEI